MKNLMSAEQTMWKSGDKFQLINQDSRSSANKQR